jgi:predicted nucleotidyltransferase component of viral defense system
VKYETPKAFRTALEQRLKNEAQASGTALVRLRKRVAFERFLARLAASESGGWMLKGAFALELRLGLRTRTTKDIDLGRADDEEAATKHLNAATGVDLGDFFSFEARRTPALDAATGFRAVRYTVRADLDGRRFEQFPTDVAFGESPPIQAESFFTANVLGFADVATPQLPVVPLEQHVAEKLHAYTGSYGQDARESTRVKDLIDLVLIGELTDLEAERLSRALATTFEERARQPLPAAVPQPPPSWARPYAELAREVGIAVQIEAGHAAAARLLDPVLRSEAEGRWDPGTGRWRSRA